MGDETRRSDLEREFGGGWHFWMGLNGRPYARRHDPPVSPPNTMQGEDWTDLRDRVRAWIRRQDAGWTVPAERGY